METYGPIAVVVVAVLALIGAGTHFTELGPWYRALRKPSWQPPDFLFGPVWTTIFALAGTSAVMAWYAAASGGGRATVVGLFVANAVLNALWSFLFFKIRRPDLALVEVALLWLSIVALIVALWPLSQTASLLLVPYLLWVSFASLLNATIVRLNPRTQVRAP